MNLESDIEGARVALAAAFRWAARLGYHEGICNHFSLMVPGRDDCFLINPHGRHWSQMRASDLVVLDADGAIVEGEGRVEDTALYIHWRVHRALPHARCVLHTHMPYTTALTSLEDPRLRMVNQNGVRFHERVVYDTEYNGLALDNAEGDRIAAALGGRDVMFMGNHGVLVVGRSLANAWDDLYYLERACENQVLAMSTGIPLREIPTQLVTATQRQILEDPGYGERHLSALIDVLDAEEPGFRQ
ncbi:MAG: aldolase [Alphaproteobacteria bacterium]|nr:aldolase [Alphaproteobacteria bacterium]